MYKPLFLFTMVLVISISGIAQDSSVLSEKHRQQLESVTDSTERAKLYEKYLEKDTKKQAKKELKKQSSKEVNKLAAQELSASGLVTDSLTIDSAAVASEIKQEGTKQLQEQTGVNIQEYNYLKRDSTGISIDSAKVTETVKSKGEQLLKNTDEYKAMSGMEGSDLDKMMEYQEQIEQTQEELRQMAAQDELKKQMTSKAKDYIMQNADQIQQVQGQMTELKAKYSSVPNSNDLSTATKRSSLKGEPIWKRFFFGLNFSVPSLSPFTMNLAPQLGYRIDKRFDVGVSGTYKVEINGAEYYINSDSKELLFKDFEKHILETYPIPTVSNPLRKSTNDNSGEVSDYLDYSYLPIEIQGDWVKIRDDKDCYPGESPSEVDIVGWVRWRKDGKFILKVGHTC